jgi:hypothetical protein
MALIDRIELDTSGMSAETETALLKGLAYTSSSINESTGNLDINDPIALKLYFKNRVAQLLKLWSKNAHRYEIERANVETDITNA